MNKITQAQKKAKAREMYLNGANEEKIYKTFPNDKPKTIKTNWLKGVKQQRINADKLEKHKRALQMLKDGLNASEIARKLGVHENTLRYKMFKNSRIPKKKIVNLNKKEAQRLFIEEKLSVQEIILRFKNFHKVTVARWLKNLNREDRKQKRNEETNKIIAYYLSECEKGNEPYLQDLAKKFGRCKDYISKIVEEYLPRVPKNGICQIKKNGKIEVFCTARTLKIFLGKHPNYISQTLNKIPRIRRRTELGKNAYLYPLREACEAFPDSKNLLARIQKFHRNDIASQCPQGLSENAFVVLRGIVDYQEDEFCKPTEIELEKKLQMYYFDKYLIRESIVELKSKKYIIETQKFFFILEGPSELLLENGFCREKTKGQRIEADIPRFFTNRRAWKISKKFAGSTHKKNVIDEIIKNLICHQI